MGKEDSVSGAILTIPKETLDKIGEAEEKITSIKEQSKKTADAVKKHFGEIMVSGVDAFIQKLKEVETAFTALDGKTIKMSVPSIAGGGTSKEISELATQMATLTKLFADWGKETKAAAAKAKSASVDIEELKTRLSSLDPKNLNIAELTKLINDLQTALRSQGVADPALEKQLVNVKAALADIRRFAETPTESTQTQMLRERTELLRQQLQIQNKLSAVGKTIATTEAKGKPVNPETVAYAEKLNAQLEETKRRITELDSKLAGVPDKSKKAWENKEALAYAKAVSDIALAVEKTQAALAKKDETDLGKAKREYAALLDQIDKVQQKQKLMSESLSKGGLSSAESATVSAGVSASVKQLEDLNRRKKEIEDKYQKDLDGVVAAHEVKRGAEAVKQHEKAEREKTKATKDAEKERYEAERRRLDLANKAQRLANQQGSAARANAKEADRIASLEDLRKHIAKVRAQIDALDKSDKNYAQNLAALNQQLNNLIAAENGVSSGMRRMKEESSRLTGMAAQLRNMLVGVFSVAAIKGYIDKLIQVSAQFELQQTALRAILQNKDEADKIFSQVQQMALQSPFSIMEMNTFVKQLAAYRIESEKLVGTTKMLADVSAGLGVDMQRLILVYGQVKSANYLRACLGRGTKVKMLNGSFKNVEDVVTGDILMGDDERPRHIGKLYQGEQQMYRVSYDGGGFRCNEHHILTVYDALKERIEDVFVLDYLKEPHRYQGVRRVDGKYVPFFMKVETDNIDTYYGFSVDGNHRFIIEDNVVTHNTEVRQFTEAGLNIAGELAQYFSELQDKMISVGDVMEMITKRMVRFEDVEEVLKRVTSAGGLFYDMQRKQSETLWGQMQRIKDAMSIMFNEIGKSNEGMILDVVKGIRGALQNWRAFAMEIKGAVLAVGAWRAAMLLAAAANSKFITTLVNMQKWIPLVGKSLVAAGASANKLALALRTLGAATLPGVLVTGLLILIHHLIQARAKAEQLQESLEQIGSESVSSINDAIANFVLLTNAIDDTNKSYAEREEALKDLQHTFAGIIPKYKLEGDYLKSLKGDYTELTNAIREYYQAKEYEKKIEAIQTSDYAKDATQIVEETMQRMNEEKAFDFVFPKENIKKWADDIARELITGELPNSLTAIEKRVREVTLATGDISKYFKESYGKSDFTDVIDQIDNLKDKEGDLTISSTTAANAQEMLAQSMAKLGKEGLDLTEQNLEKEKSLAEARIRNFEQHLTLLRQSRSAIKPAVEEYEASIEKERRMLENINIQLENVEKARAAYMGQQFVDTVNNEWGAFEKLVKQLWDNDQAMKGLEYQGKKNDKQYKDLAKTQKSLTADAEKMAKKFGVDVADAMVGTSKTSYDLEQNLAALRDKAFPSLVKIAVKELNKLNEGWLGVKGAVMSFFKSVRDLLPENMKGLLPDLSEQIAQNDAEIAALRDELKGTSETAENTGDSLKSIVSERAKKAVDKYGANMAAVNNVIDKLGDTARETAKSFRGQADSMDETVAAYKKAEAAGAGDVFLKANTLTKAEIVEMEKNAKAIRQIADEIFPDKDKGKSKGKGRDIWSERLSLMQKVNKEYEKLLQYYTKDEAQQRILKSFGAAASEVFKGTKWANIADWGGFDDKATINRLKDLATKAGKEARKKILEAVGVLQAELDLKIKKEEIDKAKKEVTEMFGNYELSKTLTKLGLNIDLTYMVGGKPTTLADVKKQIRRLRAEAVATGGKDELVKFYTEQQKKITELEIKAQQERLKNYYKYLVESFSTAAQIQIKAQQEVNKFLASEDLDAWTKREAQRQINLKKEADLAKLAFQDFQASDTYVNVFSDIENASRQSLEYVIERLQGIKDAFKDMPADQVRAIVSQLQKAKEALAQQSDMKSIFKNLRDGIKYASERNRLEQQRLNLEKQKEALTDKSQANEKKIYDLTNKMNQLPPMSREYAVAAGALASVRIEQTKIVEQLGKVNAELADVNAKISAGVRAWKAFQASVAKASSMINDAVGSLDEVFAGLDSMGLVSDEMRDGRESSSEILGGVSKTMDSLASIDINRPFSIITGFFKAIGGVLQTISGFFGIGDKKKERQIQRLQLRVDDLSQSYENLESAIDAAYALDDYKLGYRQAESNLKQQKAAYKEMLALEQSKKKRDDERIREYQNGLDEIAEKERELRQKRIEDMGSTTDYRSEAEDFVNAWLDAYREVGDGTDALKENWDEFIDRLVVKQAAMAIVSKRIARVVDMINDAIESGKDGLSLAEYVREAGKRFKDEASQTNELLKEFFDAYGVNLGTAETVLSDLQKGIQNITEPQAAAIEAYLNSMRFEVFKHTEQLSAIVETIRAQYGGGENPMLEHVKAIRDMVTDIRDDLRKVIVNKNANTQYVVKVN